MLTACRAVVVVFLLALAAFVGSACAGSGVPTGLPVEDDFSDCSQGWSTDEDQFVALSCTDGDYRVLIKNSLKPQNARLFFSEGVPSLEVAADVTRRAGPRAVNIDRFLIYGLGCWASRQVGYLFALSPDGAWGIERITSSASPPTLLAESATANAVPGLEHTNRIRAVCVGGGRRPTTLALYVNGKKIAVAKDPAGLDEFPGFGFFVASSKTGADVRFDNLVAREPDEVTVRRARVQPVPIDTASRLCSERGIRYAGTTAQGAEVCFTLRSDGRKLLETAYKFVGASGCPRQASGTVRSDFPAEVAPSGRFVNPDGLAGRIRGTTAAGVLEDAAICPGKRFRWTATRRP